MRLLIVEDDAALGPGLRSQLAGRGYAVDLATNGIDGAHLGATEPYDAVILDPRPLAGHRQRRGAGQPADDEQVKEGFHGVTPRRIRVLGGRRPAAQGLRRVLMPVIIAPTRLVCSRRPRTTAAAPCNPASQSRVKARPSCSSSSHSSPQKLSVVCR